MKSAVGVEKVSLLAIKYIIERDDVAIQAATDRDDFKSRSRLVIIRDCAVAQGALTQDRDGTVHRAVEPLASPPAPVAPAVRADHLREKVVYPSGNVRVVITGTTNEEIIEAEKRIRAAYAQGL